MISNKAAFYAYMLITLGYAFDHITVTFLIVAFIALYFAERKTV